MFIKIFKLVDTCVDAGCWWYVSFSRSTLLHEDRQGYTHISISNI